MHIVGYLAAAVSGLLLGWLACAVLLRRPEREPRPADIENAKLSAQVIARSSNGYVVTDTEGNVLLANSRAAALGVISAGMTGDQITAAIGRAAVSDDPVDVDLGTIDQVGELTGPRGRPSVVHAVVGSIGDGLILVSASDESAAQRLEAVRRDFVANVSHELKTPVGAIALLAEAVLDGADDPETVRHFAAKLFREATRLGALVNELMALSRLQGAEPLNDLVVVEVDAVIAEAVGRVATAAEAAGTAVTADRSSGLLVRGDRTLLVTAVTNLIDNAINYSPNGSPVSVSRTIRNDMVEIAVTDRGIGIAPEFLTRVFERFFRIDPARSRTTGGTGLGLAIVKHVAANHGGSAEVWSRPGTGSTFTLRIPLEPSNQSPSSTPAVAGPGRDPVGAVPWVPPAAGRPVGVPEGVVGPAQPPGSAHHQLSAATRSAVTSNKGVL